MPTKTRPAWWPIAMLLPLLLSACAALSPPSSPRVPPLPQEARQPPTPAWCAPTCSSALTSDYEALQSSLTGAVPPALPASAPTDP